MKKEIGSEFWSVPTGEKLNTLFKDNTRWFISGTSALEYILEELLQKQVLKTAAVPSWCCECMIIPFLKKGIMVYFYDVYIGHNNQLICDYSSVGSCDLTLVVSYFGYTGQKNIGTPSGTILRDVTHSLFSRQYNDAQYYFGSLRKWAGFWTGGYAWTNSAWTNSVHIGNLEPKYVVLRRRAMSDKLAYLKGKSNSKAYLELFEQGEDYLDGCNIVVGSIRDIEVAKSLDIDFIKSKRRTNAKELLKYLNNVAIFSELGEEDCPLFVPIVIPKEYRDALRSYLIKNNVYCPIHWGISEYHQLSGFSKEIYDNELSVICDQRYNIKDMQYIVELIKNF